MKDLLTVELRLDEPEILLSGKVAKKAGKKGENIDFHIVRKAIDARNKNDIKIVYNVKLGKRKAYRAEFDKVGVEKRVIVIGAGPAGLFCALYLARHGIKPLVFERGERVEKRKESVSSFFGGGALNVRSNVQFGEGGAGAFSDGKLNTQVNNELIGRVLEDFVHFGAPNEVVYLSKPHVGSDNLPSIVRSIREEIEKLGGEFFFESLVEDVVIKDGKIVGVIANGDRFDCDSVVLAIGHSARDTFEMLFARGVVMESKDFAMGYRIEQRQELINKDRFGRFFAHERLSSADYKLVSHLSERAVFTFSMCPGGQVVAASSEERSVCVNGMSNFARDMENANSAVVCQIKKEDFGNGVLDGVRLQREIERKAFELAGGDYVAPVQLAEDFVNERRSVKFDGVSASYPRGTAFCDLTCIYPKIVVDALKRGLFDMDSKIKGFASCGAVLTGVETRTSSPVRIKRGENFESVNVSGLYPCGEGCGYAGGITSAAADGIKVAEAIFNKNL